MDRWEWEENFEFPLSYMPQILWSVMMIIVIIYQMTITFQFC